MAEGRARSTIGGIVYPGSGAAHSGGFFSWPFARITLDGDGVELGPRGVFTRLRKPMRLPYDSIDYVEHAVERLRFTERLTSRVAAGEGDGLYFVSWPQKISDIMRVLRERGVDLRAAEETRGPS